MQVSAKADIGVSQAFILLAKAIKKQIDYDLANPGSDKMASMASNKKNKKAKLASTKP